MNTPDPIAAHAAAINHEANLIVAKFHARYQSAGISIESAACVSGVEDASREVLRLARSKLCAEINAGWGGEAAQRWEKALRQIWG